MIENLLFASFVQSLGDLVVVMLVVGLALYGWQHGLFLATLAGLEVLGSFFAAIFLADLVAPLVSQAGCDDRYTFAVAFVAILLGWMAAIRLAAWAAMRGAQVRLKDVVDRTGGVLMGGLAGYALAGAVLVSWSMAPAPAAFELRGARLMLDAGTPLLKAAARSTSDAHLAERLVRAYERGDWEERKPAVEAAAKPEPAADTVPAVNPQP